MWTQTRTRPSSRRAEIASSKSLASSGSIVKVGSAVRSTRASAANGLVRGGLRLGRSRARVGAAQAAVEHQALEHVAGHVGTSQPADHPRAALARADQHEVALTRPAALDRRARAVAEQRLGDQEAAALLEHGDERLVEAPRRTAADCRAHSLSDRTSSATGSASSRFVRGLSTAFTCGLMPFVVIVLPPGR